MDKSASQGVIHDTNNIGVEVGRNERMELPTLLKEPQFMYPRGHTRKEVATRVNGQCNYRIARVLLEEVLLHDSVST